MDLSVLLSSLVDVFVGGGVDGLLALALGVLLSDGVLGRLVAALSEELVDFLDGFGFGLL